MAQSLSEKINRYFNLMEDIRAEMFRVIDVSDRYFGIVSFNTNMQALQTTLVSRSTLMEVKLLEGIKGAELIAFGNMVHTVEQWVAGGMKGAFPIEQTKDVYAKYRAATSDEPQAQSEPEPANAPQTDADVLDPQELDNIKVQLLSFDDSELIDHAAQFKLGTRTRLRCMGRDDLLDMLFDHHGIYAENDQRRNESVADWLERIPLDDALREVDRIDDSSVLDHVADAMSVMSGVNDAVTRARIKQSLKELHTKPAQ
ncbi:hypothetical protein pEaSNUABM46_00331 [Erwinia phage pEa_SNUABM_46]|nr:hypothetical protein pEaSNUABM45_00331 [Erwinia phage pEa_SNUABM_45]QYW04315.1 hypothetical protein pEaSNUABM46_00331 [Erwinia phage pEa_SNUABM_46]